MVGSLRIKWYKKLASQYASWNPFDFERIFGLKAEAWGRCLTLYPTSNTGRKESKHSTRVFNDSSKMAILNAGILNWKKFL